MLKLVKYEFIKKSNLLLILLITAILANVGLGLAYGENGMALFLGLSLIILSILYLYELVRTYSDDLNKKTGYMLFMTPNSGYKIIVSKLIFIILEGLVLFVSYFIFVFFNLIAIAFKMTGDFSKIIAGIQEIMNGFNMLLSGSFGFNIGDFFLIILMSLISIIVFVLIIYSAMTIRKSIFSNSKFGGLLSFIIFIIISFIYTNLMHFVGEAFQFNAIAQTVLMTYPSAEMFKIFGIMIIFNSIIIAALMLGSGYLIEKKINL
jgi:hypothetical protein